MEQRQIDEMYRQIDAVHKSFEGHDTRLRKLEIFEEVMRGEVVSLRDSRHQYGQSLTAHSLNISKIEQEVENLCESVSRVERGTTESVLANQNMREQLVQIRADIRHALWLVGLLAGGAAMFVQALFKYVPAMVVR